MDLAQRIANLSPKQRELLESKLKERNIDVSQISRISRATGLKQQEKAGYAALKPVEKKEYYPLSSVQKRLYFLWQFDDKKIAYNISCRLVIENSIDKVRLEDAFRRLIKRHETLRMSVDMISGELVQRIHDQVEFAIEYWEKSIDSFIRSFDLSGVPLLRSGLIKLAEEKYILLLDMHHIVTDGTSLNLFIKEWSALYAGKELPPLKLQYKDYSEWQNSEEQKETMERQGTYWINQLEGEIPSLELPYDYPRPEFQDFAGDTVVLELPGEDTRGLIDLAAGERATFYMVLLAVVTVWLSKLSNQEEILIGTPIAARRVVDLENIIGMFVNTLVIRNTPEGTKTFREFLKEVKERTLQAFENQEYPFEELVEKVVVNREARRNPLFDVMFTLHTMKTQAIDIPGLKITFYNDQQNISKFDMVIQCFEIDGTLRCNFEYSTKLLKRATIERFVNYFKKLISIAIENPGIKISDIKVITDEERKQILFTFNDTEAAYPGNLTIHEWFAAQVVKTPDHIASVFTGQQLSYRALNARANQLARLLREKGVKPDTIVGIMVKRSLEILIGMIGIWKAGGAYLPIDTEYPLERKKYMLMNSGARLLLFNYAGESPGGISEKIKTIDLGEKHIYQGETSDLNHISQCTDLVYVIYTSGSTGNPKGVLLEHRNLVNLLDFQFRCTNIDCSKILQFATLCFDASFHEIFSALLSGGTIFLVSENIRADIPKLFKMIEKNRIRTLFLPISFLKIIFSEENYITLIPGCITHIQTAGEQVVISNNFRKYLRDNQVYLHNHYGPSETHVVTTLTIDPRGNIPSLPSIGKPVANTRIYIMDKYAHLLPVGIPGELYIGGIQVGRGYLNKPELTAEKFDHDLWDYQDYQDNYISLEGTRGLAPLSKKVPYKSYKHLPIPPFPHSPIYITGDLARWLNDGNIEFLGRIDHQVKIRGFRVEKGEIEKQLLNHHQVKEAVVEVKTDENGDKYLCAYVVPGTTPGAGSMESEPRKDDSDGLPDLRNYLSGKLPDYMIPAHFVFMENIPLTPNGKVNRKALPEPGIDLRGNYRAPGNKLEEKLVEIWSEVLGIEKRKISVNENFFALGGHSLKVTVMTARIHKELNVELPLAEVFKNSTISKLSGYLKRKGLATDKYESIKPIEKKEYYALSSAQKRLYISQQMEPGSTAYNIPQIAALREEIPAEKLEQVFRKLIARHESLRTSFLMPDREPVQKVHEFSQVEFEIEYKEVEVEVKVEEEEQTTGDRRQTTDDGRQTAEEIRQITEDIKSISPSSVLCHLSSEFIRPFDLSRAPLLRVGLIKLLHTPAALRGHPSQEGIEGKYLLLVDMHHIVSDAVSQELLIGDFAALYSGRELPVLKIQYKDFSAWQDSRLAKETIKHQEQFWLNEFSGEIPVLDLPADYPRPAFQTFAGRHIRFEIPGPEETRLKTLALEEGATLFVIFLAVTTIFLSKLTGLEDIIIGIPIAGRRHPDLEQIIGMFVNTLALRNYPAGEKTFVEFLSCLKEHTLTAFENQDYPFDELVEKLPIKRDPSRNPLFDVMFAWQKGLGKERKSPLPGDNDYLESTDYDYENRTSKFDLSLDVVERDKLLFILEYNTQLFKPESIDQFIVYFKQIVTAVISNKHIKLSEIAISHDFVDLEPVLHEDQESEFGF
jgi:iturin family lipopeptide synthetase B